MSDDGEARRELSAADPSVVEALDTAARQSGEELDLDPGAARPHPAVLAALAGAATAASGDSLAALAGERARDLFAADRAWVHLESHQAALGAAFRALLEPGDRLLTLGQAAGGLALTGREPGFPGRRYQLSGFGLEPASETVTLDLIKAAVDKSRPDLILAGAWAYPRLFDYAGLAEIAAAAAAYLVVDLTGVAGLAAAGLLQAPGPLADALIVPTGGELRGPPGALLLAREEHARRLERALVPPADERPPAARFAGQAAVLALARRKDYADYLALALAGAERLAAELARRGLRLVTHGTNTTRLWLDLGEKGPTGGEAAARLAAAGLLAAEAPVPRQTDPGQPPGGLALDTAGLAALGLGPETMPRLADWLGQALDDPSSGNLLRIRDEVKFFRAENK